MLATRHYMIDAYASFPEQTNNMLLINDFIVNITNELDMEPVMPPFLLPFYYCEDAEDVGISAFCICADGSHITIHTFPERSCYFIDILTNSFLEENKVKQLVCDKLYAGNMHIHTIDRRDFVADTSTMDTDNDFGPHFMITATAPRVTMEAIYQWLEHIAPRIQMQPITRPYVIYDRTDDPHCISGVLLVAQSHIAFHYSLEDHVASIDIFSCSFLDTAIVEDMIRSEFGENAKVELFTRGSKHRFECQHHTRQARIKPAASWRDHLHNL